jgi:ribose transport system permease protein
LCRGSRTAQHGPRRRGAAVGQRSAVIGGCSLRGGKGTVVGVVLGVVFVTILANGMDLLRLGSNYQMIILGLVLIAAVVLDRYRAT